MSLEAALAAENDAVLNKIGVPVRGRSSVSNERSLSPHHYAVSGMRSLSRGRSTSRRRKSSGSLSQADLTDFRWSILNHDPSERFVDKNKANGDDDDDVEFDSDDISEEELISDDEENFDFDINDIVLPNYKISINQFYKRKSGHGFKVNNQKNREFQEQLIKDKKYREEMITNRARELRKLTEVLSLKKAVEAAKASGSDIPKSTVTGVTAKLKELGIKDPERMNVEEIVDLESKKDKAYKAYKDLLIDKSKDKNANDFSYNHLEKKLTQSELSIQEKHLRVSRTITLGDFFHKEDTSNGSSIKSKDVDSYLIYLDLSPDSVNALQYTIGTVVKSGDVLYLINSVDDERDIEYYKKQCEKFTEIVTTYLNLIYDEKFTLHVVLETTFHQFPRHFLNELIRYLKPNLFIVGYKLLLDQLSNYISTVPILVVKKKTKRKPIVANQNLRV